VIIENVPGSAASDATSDIIKNELKKYLHKEIYVNTFNACPLSGSSRKRTFFTTFPIVIEFPKTIKRFEFNLEPYADVKYGFNEEISYITESKEFNTYITERKIPKQYLHPFERKQQIIDFMNEREGFDRWSFGSDSNKNCSSALVTGGGRYPSGIVVDRRGGDPLVRMMTVGEGERLMGFPKNYLKSVSVGKSFYALGDSIVVPMAEFMLANYSIHLNKNRK
jgi:site-specific DNA-cytosine methylase